MTITISLPDGPKKRRIIEMAFGKLTLAGYEFGRTPEEINDAMSELDAMMLEWPFSGLGYVGSTYATGGAEEQSGIPDDTLAAVATQLALRIAPNMGKSLPPEAQGAIAKSYALLQAKVATIPVMPMEHNTVRGAGHRTGFGPFIQESAPIPLDEDPGDLAGLIE
jgi:hypothetical protein